MATVVNDAHLFSVKRMIDLSRLNEAERRVLRLLAEGHTAKSIAAELATSPAAVNERLREARRKTGVGSSRELARYAWASGTLYNPAFAVFPVFRLDRISRGGYARARSSASMPPMSCSGPTFREL